MYLQIEVGFSRCCGFPIAGGSDAAQPFLQPGKNPSRLAFQAN
jgi:hypothetical protein